MRMRRNVYAVPMFRQIERLRWNQQADIHLVIVRKFMPMNHAVPVAAETVRVTVKAVPMTHAVAVRAGAGRAARAVVACIPRLADGLKFIPERGRKLPALVALRRSAVKIYPREGTETSETKTFSSQKH